jgi:DNA-binding GntR family transcriptional regulator
LLDTAARASIERASTEQIDHALALIDELLTANPGDVRQHDALRRLAEFYIDVADHLVLRLMINGLRTSFLSRMHTLGIRPKLDDEQQIGQIQKLRDAVVARDPAAVGAAMKEFNRLFRDSAREALLGAEKPQQRNRA